MLETLAAQLCYTASVVFGLPFSPRSLDQTVNALLASYCEFGTIGGEGTELLGGPALDEQTRREMQRRHFRAQAGRAARETRYYRHVFEQVGLNPARLHDDDISHIPLTPKEALRDHPDAFVSRTSAPVFRTTTTGTTGRPTSVCFSQRELHAYIALAAISYFEPSHGLLELLNPFTGTPAGPGELATLVMTPFPPFRETTLLLRYDTEDIVRVLDGPPTCSLHHRRLQPPIPRG